MKIKNNILINNLNIKYILRKRNNEGPRVSVLFLCGYNSDMQGTKAKFLNKLSKKLGFEFLRFDYSGHGKSEGKIENETISNWLEQSITLIKEKISYPLIIIGSSMGGWLALLIINKLKNKIKGFIGIACAPDFTEDLLLKLNPNQKKKYYLNNYISIPNKYGNNNYVFKKNFILDAKKNYVLKKEIISNTTIILLYGLEDKDVSLNTQLKILKKINSKESKLYISKESDHRMSNKKDLLLLERTLTSLIKDIS
ncbi:MAG: alpha/beta hydrolase [Rickettsiales bacterium]|nr:alpha/beta hydrolase [Rickettsiales bacterium]